MKLPARIFPGVGYEGEATGVEYSAGWNDCVAEIETIESALVAWVVDRWRAEVANRPLANIHRRSLDDTWRQILRHLGSDDVALLGPAHDDLLAAAHR